MRSSAGFGATSNRTSISSTLPCCFGVTAVTRVRSERHTSASSCPFGRGLGLEPLPPVPVGPRARGNADRHQEDESAERPDDRATGKVYHDVSLVLRCMSQLLPLHSQNVALSPR